MSQLTDIYNSLMDDPDIVPPKKMSKDKYVLNMARQRIQQRENNAAALEMGFTKTFGHFANGNSAVDRLVKFVNPPEASPSIALSKAKEPQHFHPKALKYLLDRNYSNAAIEDIRKNHPSMGTRAGKPILEIGLKDIEAMISDNMASTNDARKAGEKPPTAKSHPAMFKPVATAKAKKPAAKAKAKKPAPAAKKVS